MRQFASQTIGVLFVLSFSIIGTMGQDFEAVCRELFESAFDELSQSCAGLATDSLCYGYGGVIVEIVDAEGNMIDSDAPFVVGDQTVLVDAEGERIIRAVTTTRFAPLLDASIDGLHEVQRGETLSSIANFYNVTINTLADLNDIRDTDTIFAGDELRIPGLYDPEASEDDIAAAIAAYLDWGLATISTSAQHPAQSGDDGTRYLVFGATQIRDVTPIEQLFIADATLVVSVDNAEIFTAPPNYPLASTVIATVSGDFEADAISPDGAWVRVAYTYPSRYGNRLTAWLQTNTLTTIPDDLDTLAVLDTDAASPMQAITVEIEGRQTCAGDKTAGVIVQSADDVETDVVINRVPIRLTGTVFVELTDTGIRLTGLAGIIQIAPDETDEPVVLIPSFSVTGAYQCPEADDDAPCDANSPDVTIQFATPMLEDNTILDAADSILFNMPSNVIRSVPEVTTTNASGSGSPVVGVGISDADDTADLIALCQAGLLPTYICDSINQ